MSYIYICTQETHTNIYIYIYIHIILEALDLRVARGLAVTRYLLTHSYYSFNDNIY